VWVGLCGLGCVGWVVWVVCVWVVCVWVVCVGCECWVVRVVRFNVLPAKEKDVNFF